MPRLSLDAEQVAQLNEWLYGGPTDPTGLIAWLAAHPQLAGTPIYEQAAGERDLYLLLLALNPGQIRPTDLTPAMMQSLLWVADSLDADEARGAPIPAHQQKMRPTWSLLRGK